MRSCVCLSIEYGEEEDILKQVAFKNYAQSLLSLVHVINSKYK
jgi:hypothetical protein